MMLRRLFEALGSYWLVCVLLVNLFLLTWFGTLYQVDNGLFQAQKQYFESWYVVQHEPVPLVLPGGLTTMGLLAVNLLVGGLVRIRKSWRTAGVIVIHVGMAMLLAAAFVKQYHSEDGHLTLLEPARDANGKIVVPGEASDEFVSYHRVEVAIWDASQKRDVLEYLIPDEQLVDLEHGRRRVFTSAGLPFELELEGYLPNAMPMPVGDDGDAYRLMERPERLENEANLPGMNARFRELGTGRTGEAILCAMQRYPATFEAGGKTWAVSLRRQRYSMPFTIRLEDFRKVDHPGLSMARAFESDVVQIVDGRERPVRIQMNEPLRADGLVLFQSSWFPQDGPQERVSSVFSVVRNPSDKWPEISCYVIGVGLVLAFAPRLRRFVRAQREQRQRNEVPA